MESGPADAMAVQMTPPDGWHRASATHRDRKYTSATPVAFEHDSTGRRIEIVPTLTLAPGDDEEWQIREVHNDVTLVLGSADDRKNALAIAREAMQGH